MCWHCNLLCREAVKLGLISVNDIDLSPGLHSLFDPQIEDGLSLIRISSNQHDVRGLLDFGDAVSHHPGLAGHAITWTRKVAVMVINIRCADDVTQQLLEEVVLLIGGAGRTDAANGFGSMLGGDLLQTRS